MREPLVRYVATCSVFQITILCQSVMSFHSPDCWSLVRRFVASENFEIEIPLATNRDRKSTRLNSSHLGISYVFFCLKKKHFLVTLHATPNIAAPISGRLSRVPST